jgi:class 3 adenylate cyclase
MEHAPIRRRLTAILAADAVGYSARMGEDDERTLRTLAGHRQVMSGLIAAHDGRLVGTSGDGVLAEFASSVEAVRCAVEIQEALATRNDLLPQAERLQFRIGVNLGDVIVEGADILGDGVNVAARLESIAEPGGICVASSVFDQISGKLNLGFEDIGEQSLKNIARPVRAYRFAGTSGVAATKRARSQRKSPIGLVAAAIVALVAVAAGVYAFGLLRREPAQPTTAVSASVSEETQLKLQIAEAERAKAEAELARIRAEAEKAQAAPPPRAAAVQAVRPAPTTLAPTELKAEAKTNVSPPSAEPPVVPPLPEVGRGPRAGGPAPLLPYRGGMAEMLCEAGVDEPEIRVRGPVRVTAGEIVIANGSPGRPGSFMLRGRPGPVGGIMMRGNFVGRGQARGTSQFQGKLVNGRGTLVGNHGRRDCTVTLELN